MKYKSKNIRILTSTELLTILCKSATLYSEYADTTLLFIFREKKSDAYDFYEVRFGKNNFILQKYDGESTYNKLFYEIKKELFQAEKEFFSDELKKLIAI